MPLAVNTTLPVVTVQGSGAPVALQPGAVVSARVLHVADSGQVQINIGGQALTVRSEVPLQPGQTLQLSVSQTADGVRLAVVPQQAATANPAQLAAAMLSGDAALREAALAAKGINIRLAWPATPRCARPRSPPRASISPAWPANCRRRVWRCRVR